jgi:hypothetical protein
MKTRSGNQYNTKNLGETEYYIQLAQNFKLWKKNVNKMCKQKINMSCDELPDMDYYSFYVENVSPIDMYQKIIKQLCITMLN